jgi:hypothetical protein
VAVREFDGTDDVIEMAIGGLSAVQWTDFTYAFILKRARNATNDRIFSTKTSGDFARFEALFNDNPTVNAILNVSRSPVDADSESTFTVTTTDAWVLVGVNKASGTNAPRSHKCVMSTTTWTHSNNANTLQNMDTSAGAGGFIDVGNTQEFPGFFQGRMAVGAIWTSALSDGDFETLTGSLQDWVDLSPAALWAFNQASVATPVDDLTGTSDQTAITGTTVVTGDDPPGFSFDLGVPASRNLFLTRSNLDLV